MSVDPTARRAPEPIFPGDPPLPVEVFWRPGCPQCRDLRGVLLDHDLDATWRNLGTDPLALDFVRRLTGSETVPIVRVGGVTLTDPSWRAIAPLIGRDPDEPARALEPRPYASAGACTPDSDSGVGRIWATPLLLAGLALLGVGRPVAGGAVVVGALLVWLVAAGRQPR